MLCLLWYLQRRFSRRPVGRRDGESIQVLGRKSLGTKAHLVVVQTDDARYVLGVTERGVSVVDKLPTHATDVAAPAQHTAARPTGPSFARALTTVSAADAATAPEHAAPLRADRRGQRAPTLRQPIAGSPGPAGSSPLAVLATFAGLWPSGKGRQPGAQRTVSRPHALRWSLLIIAIVVVGGVLAMTVGSPAHAAVADPTPPAPPSTGTGVTIDINGIDGGPSASVLTLLAITLLSVAPALLLMMSSFTKIFVVLAMTRNALSLPTIPPNQVLAGLALFLSLFIMWPVLTDINQVAVQPYSNGSITFAQAVEIGQGPLREWMLPYTRQEDLALMSRAAGAPNPADPQSVPMYTLVPAFMISELRAAFVIGFVIFVPFLVIDLVVAAALMSMGMMMLPPVMISLPFKILLFILVDGWGLIIRSLLESYGGGG